MLSLVSARNSATRSSLVFIALCSLEGCHNLIKNALGRWFCPAKFRYIDKIYNSIKGLFKGGPILLYGYLLAMRTGQDVYQAAGDFR
jgi:hypothetical protein